MGLSERQLDAAFPFHFSFCADLRLRASGPSLRRLLNRDPVGESLLDLFEVVRPAAMSSWSHFIEHEYDVFLLAVRDKPGIRLRGQMLPWSEQQRVTFVGAPALTRLEQLQAAGLELRDFAPHDPIGDFLLLQRGNAMAFDDARQLAARLRERTARLNAILAQSPDGFVLLDGQARVEFANPAFGAMLGMPAEELVGIDAVQLQALLRERGADHHPLAAIIAGQAAGRAHGQSPDQPAGPAAAPSQAVGQHTLVLERPVPRVLRLESRPWTHGDVTRHILYVRDVTRESEVDRLKSEFLNTAAHELRTPMASIFGFVELMLHRPMNDERRRDVLETVHRQSRRMMALVDELLDLARIEARGALDYRPERRRIDEVVRAVAADQHVPTTHALELDLDHAQVDVDVDIQRLAQALGNILSNAFKYSPDGGTVRLAARLDGNRVGIAVADEGIGMTPEQLERVFERFWRADMSGNIPGTGLGLSLAKEIVELHGGTIDVESAPGRGSTVTLWLPLPAADRPGTTDG